MIPLFAAPVITWVGRNRKLLLYGGLALVALLVLWKVNSWRQDAARLEEARQVAEETRKEQERQESEMMARLSAERDVREAAERREYEARLQAQQMAELARSLGAKIGVISERQRRIGDELAQLSTPEQFEARIKADLVIRHPTDTRPGFLVEELDEMAHRVAQYPPLVEKYGTLEARVVALEGQLTAQGQELAAVREQVDSERRSRELVEKGYVRVKGDYATLYNYIGVKKRAWWCLGIWKCGTRTLPTPEPAALGVN